MDKREFGAGQGACITRADYPFVDLATDSVVANATAFHFLFAGGWASGDPGTYTVYVSADNNNDAYEPLEENGSNVEVVVKAGVKNVLPSAMFNCGWCKLIGPSGNVTVLGTG